MAKPPLKTSAWGPVAMIAGAALLAFGIKDYLILSEPNRPPSPFESMLVELGMPRASTTRGEIEAALGATLLTLGFGLFLLRSRAVTDDEEDED